MAARGGEQRIPRPPDARVGGPAPWSHVPADRRRLSLAQVRERFSLREDALRQVDPALPAPVGDERVDGRDVPGCEIRRTAARLQRRLPQDAGADGRRLHLQHADVADHLVPGTPYRGLGQVRGQDVERIRVGPQQPRSTGEGFHHAGSEGLLHHRQHLVPHPHPPVLRVVVVRVMPWAQARRDTCSGRGRPGNVQQRPPEYPGSRCHSSERPGSGTTGQA